MLPDVTVVVVVVGVMITSAENITIASYALAEQ